MSVKLRSVMDLIPIYRPGGCPEEQGGKTAVKLSSNECPWEPPAAVVEAINRAATTLNRYPDFYKEELCAKLAEHNGLPAEMVSVDNGSGTILQDIVRIVCDAGDEVVFCVPSFAAYDIDIQLAGATPVHVPLDADYCYNLDGMARTITDRTRMVIICNPNNPTGTFLPTEKIAQFVSAIRNDILVAIDEAYRDFADSEPYGASLDLLKQFENVALIRTFSKAYGLAGMRIGYCLAAPDIVDAINKTIAEFSVSTVGQAAALACLEPETNRIIFNRVEEIVRQRCLFQERLAAAGIPFISSQANFVMLPGSIMDRFDACKEAGVIVRPFDNPAGIRITIGSAEQMELVEKGLGC